MAGLQIVGRPENVVLSTSTALVPQPAPVVHDVSGYYARLGVPPDATRRRLREAYQALDGSSSVELTRILKVLLDPVQRAAYDARQPGSTYFDAPAVETLLRKAAAQAARQNAEYGTTVTARDILKTLSERTGKPILEFLDSGSADGFHDDGAGALQPLTHPPAAWPCPYLLLGSTCDDTSRLAQWQEGLAHALAARGCPRFAVGFHAVSDMPFLVAKDLGFPVLFLHETAQLTGGLIAAAATAAVA